MKPIPITIKIPGMTRAQFLESLAKQLEATPAKPDETAPAPKKAEAA
ncbi:MAG: hypothetical protein HOV80_22110 [Polyangiaceae bacterium]|nr:hypothetical protein [Polyangiaceae bacterium]